MQARKTRANFYISGINIYSEIEPYIKSMKYSDSLEGESDTFEIVLEDRHKEFLRGRVPARGVSVRIELVKLNWDSAVEVLPLGVFEIDELTNRYPPSECTIKLNSIPQSSKTRGINKDRSWENVQLKKIAQDIADGAGLQLFYDVESIEVSRLEQSGESDLQFLSKICANNGLSMKVADGKLIIFDAADYESKNPIFELTYGAKNILSFSGSATLNQIYDNVKIKFKPSGFLGGLFSSLGLDDLLEVAGLNLGGDNVLTLNQKVSSQKEAERLARGKLREANKKEWTVQFNLTGDFNFTSGNVFTLNGFGIYDNRYIIDKADHTIGEGGYTTQITAHRCLQGY